MWWQQGSRTHRRAPQDAVGNGVQTAAASPIELSELTAVGPLDGWVQRSQHLDKSYG
jgi:hypothetical protein